MKKNSIVFKVHSLRTQSSPYSKSVTEDSSNETIYYLLVNMKDIPDNLPLDVNPRVPKMNTNVARSIQAAVIEPETDFYINNRGIILSGKSLSFNSSTSEVKIDLGDQDSENDNSLYGILDGGHTYKAILDKRDQIPKEVDKYVRVEVITNVQNITRLSDARNTSVQVSDIALFNLDDKFEDLISAIEKEEYSNKIAYKDNEDKEINVSELLRYLYAFDIDKFSDDSSAPVQSYSGKAQVFKRYKQIYNTPYYKSLTKELPKIVELFDTIESELPDKYSDYKRSLGSNPRFGAVRGIEPAKKDSFTQFLSKPISHQISTGYIFPIFGAFRSLLSYNSEHEKIEWLFDPLELWKTVGTSLVQNTFETYTNPQLAGKDKQLWLSNYRIVETQSLRLLLQSKKIK